MPRVRAVEKIRAYHLACLISLVWVRGERCLTLYAGIQGGNLDRFGVEETLLWRGIDWFGSSGA